MAALTVPAGATCVGCDYTLTALTVPRCPECGRGFDPADLSSMRLPGRVGTWREFARRLNRAMNSTPLLAFLILSFGWGTTVFGPVGLFALGALLLAGVLGRWKAVALGVVLSPASVSILIAVAAYAGGNAALRGTGLPGTEFHNLDPDLRCGRSTSGCLVSGGEFVTHVPNNLAVHALTGLFGPQPGAYTGPYPTDPEARAALAGAAPLKASQLAADLVPTPTGNVKLPAGMGVQLLSNRDLGCYDVTAQGDAIAPTAGETGPLTATLWQQRCLILRIPNGPQVGFTGREQDACVVLIDTVTGRPFAYYGQGNYDHHFPPVSWRP